MKVLAFFKWLTRTLAYPTFFFLCFVFFCYRTFPYDRVKDYLLDRVNHPLTVAGRPAPQLFSLSVEELTPYYFSGVELTGVKLRRMPTTPTATPPERTVDAAFPRIVARVSLLPLLLGRVSTTVVVETPTGDIEGSSTLGMDGALRSIRAEIDSVNLRPLSAAGLVGKVPLKGLLSGLVDLDLSSGKASGTVDLQVRNLEIGDGETRVPLPGTVLAGGLTLDTIRAGNFVIQASFDEGEATVQRLASRGADVEFRGTGTLHLDRDPRLVMFNLFLNANFTQAYRDKSDRTRAMFQLMEMNARMRQARTSDGSWQFRLRGSPATQLIPEPAGSERFPGARR